MGKNMKNSSLGSHASEELLRYGHYSLVETKKGMLLTFSDPNGIHLDGSVPLDLTSSGMYFLGDRKRPVNYRKLLDTDTASALLQLARQLVNDNDKHSQYDRENWKEPYLKQIVYPAFRFGDLHCFIKDDDNPLHKALQAI